jgi:hypothetical protein
MNAVNSFRPLLDRCADFDSLKSDTVARTSELHFGDEGHLVVPASYGNSLYGMEERALNQLGDRLGRHFWKTSKRTIPADFYRQLHQAWPQHFASLTNDLLQEMDGKLLVRSYGDNVRAILSDQYATLDNSELLDMADQVLGGVPYEIVQSGKYADRNDGVQRDELTVRVIVKNVKPTDEGGYGLGIAIRNGETGGSASEIRPLVMRTSCMNSLVFKVGEAGERLGLRLTHRGSKQAKAILLASAIAEALPMAEEGLERFLETKRIEIDLGAVIAKLGEEQGWSEAMSLTVGVGSEGHNSVFGLVNGITFAAHQLDMDTSARFDLESLASQFVYAPHIARA